MFQKTRRQLLLSYVVVLSIILVAFAIAVRVIFTRSLNQQLADRLETLARAAALGIDLEDGELDVDDDEILVGSTQAIQWFDLEGNLLAEQGDYPLQLPFNPEQSIQEQTEPYPARGSIVPVNDFDTGIFIGYVRVSESTAELNNTLKNLNWGLGSGVLVALTLSGVGGIWLTRQAMEPIEGSFLKLQQFTSNAAHELRSPLMAIQTNAAVALKYPEGIRESDVEKFHAIKSASGQLTTLTENLLLLARTDQKITQKQDSVDLLVILEQLMELYKTPALAKSINLQARLSQPLLVGGDAVQLTRLFANLIDNAIQYTHEGGAVEIQAQCEGTTLKVRVRDTGIGIAPEHLEKIFDRFWQADQARSYKSGGVGLGLALARGIALNHGGSISVSSELGKGSCFTVELPSRSFP